MNIIIEKIELSKNIRIIRNNLHIYLRTQCVLSDLTKKYFECKIYNIPKSYKEYKKLRKRFIDEVVWMKKEYEININKDKE